MLPPEPRLLQFMKLTAQSQTENHGVISAAAQALVIYSLLAGQELETRKAALPGTALAVRRIHGIFSIRSMGKKPVRR